MCAVLGSGPPSTATLSRRLGVAGLVWLAMVGLDFLLNGAAFARLYSEGGGFMLAPAEAFRRIPLGYLALLILALGVVEATFRLQITRIGDALRLGLASGAIFGGAWALGLYSIATLSAQVALAFSALWLALITLAWGVAVVGLKRKSLRGLALQVVAFDVLVAVVVVALQSFGLVETIKA